MYYEVIPIRQFRDDAGILTYSSETSLKPGHIVEIPLGKSKTFGIVLKSVRSVNFKTKPISKILYDTPLPDHILKSILWLSEYYLTPLPATAKLFLPNGIGKNRRKLKSEITDSIAKTIKNPKIDLNPAQKQALQGLQSAPEATKLLHGVTGSGKTNIYLKLASECESEGKSTILLVPEIALTSQLVQVFEQFFKDKIILIHSKQTEATRHKIWEEILESTTPKIIIGPRSALLSPVKDLGLVIIDEAHESTYYQENTPKYSALRLASFIASSLKISCIYGTATPILADYHLAKTKNSLITLSEKAKKTALAPNIKIIDLKSRENFLKNRYFSDLLLDKITENGRNGHQTLIFHNRRGSAPLTICEHCGWQALCPECFLPLNLHSDTYNLICHSCGHSEKVPPSCPECQTPGIIHKGIGTKLLESELKKLFKNAKIARFDADNKKHESLDALYSSVKSGEINIIIGTQTIAKGLDLPLLATIGVVQADAGLSLPDFSAEEKTYELLSQVIGRVGRGHLDAADVIIQTFQPDHPAITSAISGNYQTFAAHLISCRKKAFLPPFAYIAKLSITYKTETLAVKYAKDYHRLIKNATVSLPGFKLSTPTPAFHEKSANGYTWQIILHSASRANLLKVLKSLPKNPHLHLAIDPPSLL